MNTCKYLSLLLVLLAGVGMKPAAARAQSGPADPGQLGLAVEADLYLLKRDWVADQDPPEYAAQLKRLLGVSAKDTSPAEEDLPKLAPQLLLPEDLVAVFDRGNGEDLIKWMKRHKLIQKTIRGKQVESQESPTGQKALFFQPSAEDMPVRDGTPMGVVRQNRYVWKCHVSAFDYGPGQESRLLSPVSVVRQLDLEVVATWPVPTVISRRTINVVSSQFSLESGETAVMRWTAGPTSLGGLRRMVEEKHIGMLVIRRQPREGVEVTSSDGEVAPPMRMVPIKRLTDLEPPQPLTGWSIDVERHQYIKPLTDLEPPRTEANFAETEPKPKQDVRDRDIVKIFYLKYVRASELGDTIDTLMGGEGIRVVVNEPLNALIVHATEEDAEVIEAILAKLDAQPPSNDLPPAETTKAPTEADVAAARKRFEEAERATLVMAEKVRNQSPTAARRLPAATSALRQAVEAAFARRLELQRLEAAVLRGRLRKIESSLEQREQLQPEVVEHRLRELLKPGLRWAPK